VASPGGWFSSHFSLPGGRYGDCGGYARRSVRLAIVNVPLVARRQPASAPSPSHINLGADPSMLHTKPLNARPRQLLRDTHRTSTGAAPPGSTRSAGGCPTGTGRSWAFARTSGCPWLSAWPPPPAANPSLPLPSSASGRKTLEVEGAPTSRLEHPTCRYLVVGLDITVPGPSPSRGERGRLSALPGVRAPTRHGCL
jgi:hypothetical protein